MNIGIIDYGAGNLQSVKNAFVSIGASCKLITSPEELHELTHLVLPGQGEFGDCSRMLQEAGFFEPIKAWIAEQKPFLGICVGYQLLFEGSEESPDTPGLGVLGGQVVRFKNEPELKIPHMGWNVVRPTQPEHPFWKDIGDDPYFYYVHSYYPQPIDVEHADAETTYGTQHFYGAVVRDKLVATQFHPEKSQHTGIQLLKNFITL